MQLDSQGKMQLDSTTATAELQRRFPNWKPAPVIVVGEEVTPYDCGCDD